MTLPNRGSGPLGPELIVLTKTFSAAAAPKCRFSGTFKRTGGARTGTAP